MQLQKGKKKCGAPAYWSHNEKQHSLATSDVRATDVCSRIWEECWNREFHFNLKSTRKNFLVHFCQWLHASSFSPLVQTVWKARAKMCRWCWSLLCSEFVPEEGRVRWWCNPISEHLRLRGSVEKLIAFSKTTHLRWSSWAIMLAFLLTSSSPAHLMGTWQLASMNWIFSVQWGIIVPASLLDTAVVCQIWQI